MAVDFSPIPAVKDSVKQFNGFISPKVFAQIFNTTGSCDSGHANSAVDVGSKEVGVSPPIRELSCNFKDVEVLYGKNTADAVIKATAKDAIAEALNCAGFIGFITPDKFKNMLKTHELKIMVKKFGQDTLMEAYREVFNENNKLLSVDSSVSKQKRVKKDWSYLPKGMKTRSQTASSRFEEHLEKYLQVDFTQYKSIPQFKSLEDYESNSYSPQELDGYHSNVDLLLDGNHRKRLNRFRKMM